MKLSKIAFIACCSVLALSIIGCNPQPNPEPDPTPQEKPENTDTPSKEENKEEENKKEEDKKEDSKEENNKEENNKEEDKKEDSKEENKKDDDKQDEPEKTPEADVALAWEKIDYTTSKASYGTKYTITAVDENDAALENAYVISGTTITLKGNTSGTEVKPAVYTISGYFKGQIINEVKNNEIVLSKAYIENENAPAIIGKKKTSIKAEAETINYVISTGTDKTYEKSAAIYCEGIATEDNTKSERKSLDLGGKGTCYVIGGIYHAVRANNVELKGNGTYYFQGTADGSGINAKTLTVDSEKTVTAYFVNSKNGIKVDENVEINSGKYFFGNLKTGVKTDTTEDDTKAGKNPKEHFIHLYGDEFSYNSKNVEKWTSTDKDKYVIRDTTKINKL